MHLINNQSTLAMRSWARPKRVAFFVPEDFRDCDVNSILRYCYATLGGKYNVIVPTNGNDIGDGWLKLLVACDPDILFCAQELSEELSATLQAVLRPSRIVVANPYHKREHGFVVSESEIQSISLADIELPYRISPLFGINTTIAQIVLSKYPGEPTPRELDFCLRNFGGYSAQEWRTLDDEKNGVKRTSVADLDDPKKLFSSLFPSHGIFFPIQFCDLGYEDISFRCRPRGDELYDIVVGDSLRDVIYNWNFGVVQPKSGRRRSLWLPSAQAEKLAECVGKWLLDNIIHDAQVRLVSYSLTVPELDALRKVITPHAHRFISTHHLQADDACDMTDMSLSGCCTHASRTEYRITDTVFGVAHPELLKFPKERNRGWISEFEIESPSSQICSSFVDKTWHLPLRDKLEKKFLALSLDSRISAPGHIALEIDSSKRSFGVKVPTIPDLCNSLIRLPEQRGDSWRLGKYRQLELSSIGQDFFSVLNLFGDIHRACHYLDDEQWRRVFFALMGKEITIEQELDDAFAQLLAGKGRPATKLKRVLKRRLTAIPTKKYSLTKPQITKLLCDSNYVPSDDYIATRLHSLLSRSIFFQGSSARCHQCGSSRWYRIDQLLTVMSCEGCTSDFVLEPIDDLSYRLNEQIQNGFQRNGFIPVFQTLFYLEQRARKHFLFAPPHEIFTNSADEKPLTDIDLSGIMDEQFFICEVKSSEIGLLSIDINEMADIAQNLNPDLVLIAAPQDEFTEKAKKHCLEDLDALLKGTNIKVRAVPLSWMQTAEPLTEIDFQI